MVNSARSVLSPGSRIGLRERCARPGGPGERPRASTGAAAGSHLLGRRRRRRSCRGWGGAGWPWRRRPRRPWRLWSRRARPGPSGVGGWSKTPEQGAATSVLLAPAPALDGIGARYFEDCHQATVVRRSSTGSPGSATTPSTPPPPTGCGRCLKNCSTPPVTTAAPPPGQFGRGAQNRSPQNAAPADQHATAAGHLPTSRCGRRDSTTFTVSRSPAVGTGP